MSGLLIGEKVEDEPVDDLGLFKWEAMRRVRDNSELRVWKRRHDGRAVLHAHDIMVALHDERRRVDIGKLGKREVAPSGDTSS